jgi:sister-chromatid-cohesion protein PDS5
MNIVRLVHLLAHHPDCTPDKDGLDVAKTYLIFFCECVLTSQNASFIYCLVAKLKTVGDVLGDAKNLYILSDFTQKLIRAWCKQRSWSLSTYPGTLDLPSQLFVSLGQKEAKAIFAKNYLELVYSRETSPVKMEEATEQPASVKKPASSVKRTRSKDSVAIKSEKSVDEDESNAGTDDDYELKPKRKPKTSRTQRQTRQTKKAPADAEMVAADDELTLAEKVEENLASSEDELPQRPRTVPVEPPAKRQLRTRK